jgi:hypothetical protein
MQMPTALRREDFAFLILAVGTILLFCMLVPAQTSKPGRVTGTYTNMSFNKEGGDLLGQELKIVKTRKGYQGALQLAEGEPGELSVVDIKISGDKIEFEVPDSSPDGCRFSGTIEGSKIVGQFRFKSGGSQTVTLTKGKGYWD